MSSVRIVTMAGLRSRLASILGVDSLLFRRFDKALANRDEVAIQAAMSSLRLYPASIRRQVESALLDWLFDPETMPAQPDHPPASDKVR